MVHTEVSLLRQDEFQQNIKIGAARRGKPAWYEFNCCLKGGNQHYTKNLKTVVVWTIIKLRPRMVTVVKQARRPEILKTPSRQELWPERYKKTENPKYHNRRRGVLLRFGIHIHNHHHPERDSLPRLLRSAPWVCLGVWCCHRHACLPQRRVSSSAQLCGKPGQTQVGGAEHLETWTLNRNEGALWTSQWLLLPPWAETWGRGSETKLWLDWQGGQTPHCVVQWVAEGKKRHAEEREGDGVARFGA